MGQVSANAFKPGIKIEVDGEPYVMVSNEFVKPGKGQPFNRVKLKHLLTGRVVERTFKSGDKVDEADVQESTMRLLYQEGEDYVFMDEKTYDQFTVPRSVIGDKALYCMEEIEYDVVFYKGEVVDVIPPLFLEMVITETAPGLRGDTSGRALKSAITETGAKIQIPLFVSEGEKIKIDTRTGEYVSRV